MRGKGIQWAFRSRPAGITPAYAGKRDTAGGHCHPDLDHPRLCGEKSDSGVRFGIVNRITPAYAGKSPRVAWYNINRGDHPRLCGEKCLVALGFWDW